MIGHLIYTYNKLDDARILQEISKNYLTNELGEIYLIHSYNGDDSFGYKQYLENKLIKIENRGHFQGACDLINSGIEEAEKNLEIDYLLVTAGDTWTLKADFIKSIIDKMKAGGKVLATSAWDNRGLVNYDSSYVMNPFIMGMATDLFVLDMSWQRKGKLFPLNLETMINKFGEIKLFLTGNEMYLENVMAYSYLSCFRGQNSENHTYKAEMLKHLVQISEREPIHYRDESGFWRRKMDWDDIGLVTYHDNDVVKKQSAVQKYDYISGQNVEKLRNTKDLSYFNKLTYRDRKIPDPNATPCE